MNSRMIIGVALVGVGAYLGMKYLKAKKPIGAAPASSSDVRDALVRAGIVSASPHTAAPSPLRLPARVPTATVADLTKQAFAMVPGAT